MDAQTGLASQARDFGLLSAIPDGKVESGRKRKKDGRLDEDRSVKLGRVSTPYVLCAENSEANARCLRVATHIWNEAQQSNVTWPVPGEAISFAEKILQFARRARAYNEDGKVVGFRGGRDVVRAYTAKSLTRGMLIVAETMSPTLCDEERLENIQVFAPDENSHTQCVKTLTGLEIRRNFAVSPLMLSCWCCLAGWMKQDHLQTMLKLDDSTLMKGLDAWLKEKEQLTSSGDDYPFPPGPRAFGEMVLDA